MFKRKKLLKEKVAEKVEIPRTRKFYTPQKMYKQGKYREPAVSSINCSAFKISQYIDYHLQPLVKAMSSYVKDTKNSFNQTKVMK